MISISEKEIKNYTNKTIAQAFWSMFPALVVANIIPALSGIVNGLIVGNSFSPAAMAAISFASPISSVITSVAVIFSSGAGVAYGRYLGRGQADNVHKVYTSNFLAIIIVGAVFTAVGEIFAEPIAQLIGARGDTLATTTAYLRGTFIGILPSLLMPSLVAFLNLGNEARYGMLSSLVLAFFNLALGLLNVNVFHGEMFGIGLASSLSQYCAVLFLIIKFIKHPEIGHFVHDVDYIAEIKSILRFGAPAAILQISAAIRNMFINSMTLETGGTLAVAGLGILNSSAGFFCSVNVALVSVTATLTSICVGEEDRTSLYNLVGFLLKVGAAIFLCVGAVYSITAPYIAILFGARGEGISIAASCIRLYCAEFLIVWFTFVILGSYQSLGRVLLSSALQFINCMVYGIGMVFLLPSLLPSELKVYGVWGCYGAAAFLGAITIFIISWIKSGHFPIKVEYLLWLDKNFGVAEKDRIVISVDTVEDVVSVSRTVQKFLQDRGIDNSRSIKTALCLEEMAGNIVSHGFTKNAKKKDLSIDIYVAVKDDEIKIRIKDNAPQFNPFNKLEQYQEDANDPMKNIGIRMISKIAKEMKYQTTLGMNVLYIEM